MPGSREENTSVLIAGRSLSFPFVLTLPSTGEGACWGLLFLRGIKIKVQF